MPCCRVRRRKTPSSVSTRRSPDPRRAGAPAAIPPRTGGASMKTFLAGMVTATMFAAVLCAQERKMHPKGFDKDSLGKLPAGWKAGHTGKDGAGVWKVVADDTAPSKKGHVLSQGGESPGPVFNLCVADDTSYKDMEVSVMFKANKGKRDQGGGIVWRYPDANNYYIA